MSEQEKSLGQIGHEAELADLFDSEYTKNSPHVTPWPELLYSQRHAKEKFAQAVAAMVREECATFLIAQAAVEARDDRFYTERAFKQAAEAIRAMNEASHG